MDQRQSTAEPAQDPELFTEIILGTTVELVGGFARSYGDELEQATDARQALHDLARRFLDRLLQPELLRLRRLVLAEANRFPDISGAWFAGLVMYKPMNQLMFAETQARPAAVELDHRRPGGGSVPRGLRLIRRPNCRPLAIAVSSKPLVWCVRPLAGKLAGRH